MTASKGSLGFQLSIASAQNGDLKKETIKKQSLGCLIGVYFLCCSVLMEGEEQHKTKEQRMIFFPSINPKNSDFFTVPKDWPLSYPDFEDSGKFSSAEVRWASRQ